jgi:glycosyltransferase involved in cell wall biosynthesis
MDSDSNIAVVHGHFFSRGGAESVAAELARTFDAPLYYGFGDEENEPDDIDCLSLFDDQRLSGLIAGNGVLRNVYYMSQFQCVPELHEYDVVIQSGNEPGWYLPPDEQVVVKYTHSPPRDAYDSFPEQSASRGPLYKVTSFLTQILYPRNVPYPDLYVANSEVIARRLDRYWDKNGDEVETIYPPVSVDGFGQEQADETPVDGDYYLVLDRLAERKHVDDIVAAFEDHPAKRLVVAGTGPEAATIEQQAADLDNVELLGYVSEDAKRSLLAGAEALVYSAEDEDFGIVPIEAFASGTPVIGPREGFTQYQIEDGKTGVLYDRSPGAIEAAVARFESTGVEATAADLESLAEQFSVERFRTEMRAAVDTARKRARVTPTIQRFETVDSESEPELVATDGGDTQ